MPYYQTITHATTFLRSGAIVFTVMPSINRRAHQLSASKMFVGALTSKRVVQLAGEKSVDIENSSQRILSLEVPVISELETKITVFSEITLHNLAKIFRLSCSDQTLSGTKCECHIAIAVHLRTYFHLQRMETGHFGELPTWYDCGTLSPTDIVQYQVRAF